jgi:hypothetical protein
MIGIALSVTGALNGFLVMMNETLRPFPLVSSGPNTSANRFAQVSEVDFYAPYSSMLLEITRVSPMYSISSVSFTNSPLVSSISYHSRATVPHES